MLKHQPFVLAVILAACSQEEPVGANRKAVATAPAPLTLEECFGMYAAGVHAACEESGSADCIGDGMFDTATLEREVALTTCMTTRSDSRPCAALAEEGCPPGIPDDECSAAREKATQACESTLGQ